MGIRRYQEYTTGSGNFSTPAGVTSGYLTMVGGGAGGGGSRAGFLSGASAGGAGEFCVRVPVSLPDGGTTAYVVGTKGTGAVALATNGVDGNPSSFGKYACAGGLHGTSGVGGGDVPGGSGGGPGGGVGLTAASGVVGTVEFRRFQGGAAGGGYLHAPNHGGVPLACLGGPGPGFGPTPGGTNGAGSSAGGSGAASMYGLGGRGGNGGLSTSGSSAAATSYGAGGGGGGNGAGGGAAGLGGDGAGGYILIEWFDQSA